MMGLSSVAFGGGGGGNSSTSNLSASAPPFTVDRLNPKPNSSPMMHYSDSPYVVEPFSHSSQYPHLSAPRAEAAIDSTEIMSVPAMDGYQFSTSTSISPPSTQWSAYNSGYGDGNPFYSPYVPPSVGEGSLSGEDERSRYTMVPTHGLSVTSQHDYTQSLLGLEYRPRWTDDLGFDDGIRAKRSEVDGKFPSEKLYVGGSHGYENQLYQGGHDSENSTIYKEDSGVLYKNLNQISDRDIYTGSSSSGYIMEAESCLEQQLGLFLYDTSKTLPTVSSSPYPESYPPVTVLSSAVEKNFPDYQNSCNPYENCVRPVDTPFVGHVSVIRPSPTVVIRPPPDSNWNLEQGNASRKPAVSENTAGMHIVESGYTNPSKPNDSGLNPYSKPIDNSFETSPFKVSKQGDAPASSTSIKEVPRPVHSKDTSDCKVKTALGSRIPDLNGSSDLPVICDNIQVGNSAEESSEFVDYHSTVDSPCWKGASSSQFSMFDIETGNNDHVKMNLVEQYGFGHGEKQTFHSTVDSNSVFSKKDECNMVNENDCGTNGIMLGLEKTPNAIHLSTEQSLLHGITDRAWVPPTTGSMGVELSGGPNMMMTKEPNLLGNFTSVFDMKVSDTKHLYGEGCIGMIVNDVSEGAAVAVHAAEKVLDSPASQEDITDHTELPEPRLVSVIVKSMHSLSELLRFHISSDVNPLGVENKETLKNVMSNLSTCMSRKGVDSYAANRPEPKDPSGESSGILGESCSVGIISRGPHMKFEDSNSCPNLGYSNLHKGERDYTFPGKGERDYTFPGKKDEISPTISLLKDDLHVTEDDEMTKAIKKILEQNFEIDEDMHSKALLFKNLWLEAEAKLCSISYKARFERMKARMEELKLKTQTETSELCCTSPDPIIIPKLASKTCGDIVPKPISPIIATSGISGYADSIEASVLTRFHILRSREENLNPINTEEQHGSEIVDDNHADSVIARFNILKSREDNKNLMNTEEQQRSEIVGGKHADSVMARFNILKSREENSKPMNTEEQHKSEIVDGNKHADSVMAKFTLKTREENEEELPQQVIGGVFVGEKYCRPRVRDPIDDKILDATLPPPLDFLYRGGSLVGGNFDSYFERSGYESPVEYGGSVRNDPSIHSIKSEDQTGWHDSSTSSEWEHVMKEDFS